MSLAKPGKGSCADARLSSTSGVRDVWIRLYASGTSRAYRAVSRV